MRCVLRAVGKVLVNDRLVRGGGVTQLLQGVLVRFRLCFAAADYGDACVGFRRFAPRNGDVTGSVRLADHFGPEEERARPAMQILSGGSGGLC
jgi:hypothetical protein